MPWKMYLIVFILHLDVPQLKNFTKEPGVKEAFLRLVHETPGESRSGKDY